MVRTILIAPFLGEMVGGELDKKQNFDFGFSDTQMTRDSLVVTPVPKRHLLHTPRHANDTFDMRHVWGAKKKQLKVIT
jgi:hypothetical protein